MRAAFGRLVVAELSAVATSTGVVGLPNFLSGIYFYCLSILSTVRMDHQNNRNNEEVACDLIRRSARNSGRAKPCRSFDPSHEGSRRTLTWCAEP